MVSSIFTIPLGGATEESLATDGGADRSHVGAAEVSARAPQQYVGSDENRLVEAAINTLFASNHIDGRATPDSINPIVFFGPGGSGKSLLVVGVAARWQAQYPSDEVVQLSGVDLVHKLTEAIQVNSVEEFKNRLALASLLVIDDVHVIAGRGTAEEFLCGILEGRRNASRPTLISLDQSPAGHERLSQRLAGRFLNGLSIPLELPGEQALELILIQLVDSVNIEADGEGCRLL
ncbi:MAG: DnaA/Hda family protein, partial [Pirellulaceae bacterium]